MSMRMESLLKSKCGISGKHFLTLLCLVFFLFIAFACSKRDGTPEEYKYKLPIGALTGYSSDTLAIRKVLQKMLDSAINPFDTKWYDHTTVLCVDTLVYSRDLLHMIVLVVERNASSKLSGMAIDSPFFYKGQYLYCSRDSIGFPICVFNYSGYGFTSYSHYEEARDGLRSYCFYRRGSAGAATYNIDDIRFWDAGLFESLRKNYKAVTL